MAVEITCPNCHTGLTITLEPAEARPSTPPRGRTDITPLTDKALADVFEFLQYIGPGTRWATDLYQHYLGWTKLPRPLSQKSFATALVRNGAERWRTSAGRGYTIPHMLDRKPATMSPEQRERFEAAHQRSGPTIQPLLDKAHDPIVVPQPLAPAWRYPVNAEVLADLPFEVEVDGDDPA